MENRESDYGYLHQHSAYPEPISSSIMTGVSFKQEFYLKYRYPMYSNAVSNKNNAASIFNQFLTKILLFKSVLLN